MTGLELILLATLINWLIPSTPEPCYLIENRVLIRPVVCESIDLEKLD